MLRTPLSVLFAATALSLCSVAMAADLPKVKLFSTGGTIQGSGDLRTNISNYQAGKITPKQLLDDLPEVKEVADVSTEEISAIGSGGINAEILLKLAKSINAWLATPEASGAVVTHGTGTLEETAYFLNLVIKSEKPVVVVGAMRPFTAISRDGPFNLYNAIRTAATPESKGKGVLVVLNDTINSARDVTKANTYRVNTFESRDIGPLGFTDSDRVVYYRTPVYRHTSRSEFDVSQLTELPKVDIVYGYQEADPASLNGLVAAGSKGIILTDSSPGYADAIKAAQAKGVIVVQGDRKGSGRVLVSERARERGLVTADNLNSQKARVLLRLALTKTSDLQEIQRIFNEY